MLFRSQVFKLMHGVQESNVAPPQHSMEPYPALSMVLNIDSNDFRGIRVAMKDWLPSLSTVSVMEMDAIPSLLYYVSFIHG